MHPEQAELKAYLGDSYDQSRLERYEEQLDEEFERVGDEAEMYRSSEGYLYNLTAFAMTQTKAPYHALLQEHLPPPARLLDYGCGIGSDGLALGDEGYTVDFADFANPSVQYLRWRLQRRDREARIYDLDAEQPEPGYDLAYAFDVIEHVEDPFAFLAALERAADRVLVNFLEPEPGETDLHHELPIADLLKHAADRELIAYRVEHGRSHVVLYGSRPAGAAKRAANRLKLAARRAR